MKIQDIDKEHSITRNDIHKLEIAVDTRKHLKFDIITSNKLDSLIVKSAIFSEELFKITDKAVAIIDNNNITICSDMGIKLMSPLTLDINGTNILTICELIKQGYGSLASWGVFERTKFKSIDLSNTDFSSLTNMNRMFSSCEALEVKLESVNTEHIEEMHNTFEEVGMLRLDLSKNNFKSLKSMSSAFSGAKITSLNIDNKYIKSLMDKQTKDIINRVKTVDDNESVIDKAMIECAFFSSIINNYNITFISDSLDLLKNGRIYEFREMSQEYYDYGFETPLGIIDKINSNYSES